MRDISKLEIEFEFFGGEMFVNGDRYYLFKDSGDWYLKDNKGLIKTFKAKDSVTAICRAIKYCQEDQDKKLNGKQ